MSQYKEISTQYTSLPKLYQMVRWRHLSPGQIWLPPINLCTPYVISAHPQINAPPNNWKMHPLCGKGVHLYQVSPPSPSQKPTLDAVGGKLTASVVSGFFDPQIFTSRKKDVNSGFRPSYWIRTRRTAYSKRAPEYFYRKTRPKLIENDE